MHHRYKPQGIQAINPQALFWLFPANEEQTEENEEDDFSTVVIRGPISQHGFWWDSYESIKKRIQKACDTNKGTILLKIDSPGGEVAGCFDAARSIKDKCRKAGKKLIVHVEGQCSSAAYALACVADKIVASKTADIGSIGVLAVRYDDTKADEISGYKVNLITSGKRKADWNPHTKYTKEEQDTHQAEIDELAQEFFSLVSTYRNISIEKIKSFEAGSYRGSLAAKLGLIDEVKSLDRVLISLKSKDDKKMKEKEKEAMDVLRAIIDDEECTEEEKEKARKALAILEAEDEEEAEDGDGEEEAEDGEEEAEEEDGEKEAEDGEEEAEEEEEEDEEEEEEEEDEDPKSKKALKRVSAKTAAAITAHGAKIEKRLASVEKKFALQKKKKLISNHGGVSAGLAKILMSKPLSEVKILLAELPKPKKIKLGDAAKTANVKSLRGGGANSQGSRLPPKQAKEMRVAMGIEKETYGVVNRGNVLMLGAKEE